VSDELDSDERLFLRAGRSFQLHVASFIVAVSLFAIAFAFDKPALVFASCLLFVLAGVFGLRAGACILPTIDDGGIGPLLMNTVCIVSGLMLLVFSAGMILAERF